MAYGFATNTPYGLKPYRYQGNSLWDEGFTTYRIPTAYNQSLFIGDPVGLASGYIVRATIGVPIIGVFRGCDYVDANGEEKFSEYWAANTPLFSAGTYAKCKVVDDPSVLFDIQIGTSGGPSAAPSFIVTNIGNNAQFDSVAGTYNALPSGIVPAPNPITGNPKNGLSAYYLSSATISTANPTYNLKIIDLIPKVGNDAGVIFNSALVKINNHQFNGGTGTAGA